MNKETVLFLCSGNACRSQMAEALLRKHAAERFQVYSAGTQPKDIHPLTGQVLAEIGLGMEGQYSKGVETYLGKLLVHYLIVVCAKAAETCPTAWPGSPQMQMIVWPLEDPTVFEGTEIQKLAKFRQVRDQIDERIKTWLDELAPTAIAKARKEDPMTQCEDSANIYNEAVAELVAIGAAVAANCEPCLKYHFIQARKLGATKKDVALAVAMAEAVKTAPAKAIRDLAEKLSGPFPLAQEAGAPAEGTCCGDKAKPTGSSCCPK